ncbi:MAG: hypothetical protein IT435_16305 [Phycisphaerales bacterium]|nr:hypothetical protein [Phycisphaerales bacterium]
MRPTPLIPDWIKTFRHRDYVNVYERIPGESRLFGTETLFGDWNAPVLLLAQDCGVVEDLDKRIASGHPTPHGHGVGLPTNTKLIRLAGSIGQPKLYGSALASLWRRCGGKRRKPPAWNELLNAFVIPVISWVATQADFKAIACLGEYAWQSVLLAGDMAEEADRWQEYRDHGDHIDLVLGGRRVRAFAMYHPACPRGYDLLGKNWPALAAYLGEKGRRA